MPAKPSGKVKTAFVNVMQKNGDIYVMERQLVYNPEKKYYRIINSKLVAQIPKDEKNPVPTCPERPKENKSEQKSKSCLLPGCMSG